MTDEQWRAWLRDPGAVRVTLAELEHAAGTEQVSDAGYLAPASEGLARPRYAGVLERAVDVSTRLDGMIEFGDIELLDDGSITHWADYQWRGYPVRLYLGAPDWPRGEFRQIATAIIEGRRSVNRDKIVLGVMDASSQLDTPIDTGQLPGDAGPVPLLLGVNYNVPAISDSTTTLHYRVSYLPLTSVTPRDLGNAVPHTADLAGGGFTLDNAPGTGSEITAAAVEAHDTPAAIVQWIAAHYGLPLGLVDLPDVAVGLYSQAETSGAQLLDRLCQGLGAHWFVDALGQLTARVLVEPGATPDVTLGRDDITDGSLSLASDEAAWPKLTLRWQRNEAPLRTVAGTILVNDPAQAARFGREWNESVAAQTLTGHPLAEPVTRDSALQLEAEAVVQRDRLLALHATRREVWECETYRLDLELHQTITINVPPLVGRVGRVLRIRRDTGQGVATIGIWL
ncbi:hypothetical protein QO259_05680 [Salinicola sp. JS01]|uniref:hypothetical protein n=1 Tax=Salinicola sp. JS01 TaxID=3050071 RepID=UPI00255BB907|nr:hypothetical protein [Salinicola sp. JS01]WIX34153.1 hypothetical protein QO259_05680 [Salinicola sp. JS01]